MNTSNDRDNPYVGPKKLGNPKVVVVGSCLKALLILVSPTIVVPLLVAIFVTVLPVGVLLAIGFLVWMGMLSVTDTSGRVGYDTKPKIGQVVIYVVLQLIGIPMFWLAVLWSVCSRGGNI